MSEDQAIFSTLEIDTIGEIMNISMGSAATAASTLLDNKVTITTPVVKLIKTEDFEIAGLEPAIAVDIRYVEGISGSNILILKKEDVRKILSQMMMTEVSENFEIDEMAESAMCELMNQMMGSSATVLSCFLGRTINISTPQTVGIDKLEEFKREHFGKSDSVLTIEFTLSIDDLMESKFVSAMEVELAKEIISVSLNFDSGEGEEAAPESPAAPAQQAAPPPSPPPVQQAPPPSPPPVQQAAPANPPQMQQVPDQAPPAYAPPPDPAAYGQPPAYGAYPGYPPPYPYPQPQYAPPPGYYPPPVKVQDYSFGDFSANGSAGPEQTANMDLVMNVPVVVTVELGRTKRKIKEVLEFGQGTIVELDKQAGSQVDVIVNGELIARGDVVVVDDNFSIRITEILKNRDILAIT